MEEARFDLEERTFQFALAVRHCVAGHRWSRAQWRDIDQILRSSGSVAANYFEADNAVSKPDFIYRIGVSKKECVETRPGSVSSEQPLQKNLSKNPCANSTKKLTNSSESSPPFSANPSDLH